MLQEICNLIHREEILEYDSGFITRQSASNCNSFATMRFSPQTDMFVEESRNLPRRIIINTDLFRVELYDPEWTASIIDRGIRSVTFLLNHSIFPNYGNFELVLRKK